MSELPGSSGAAASERVLAQSVSALGALVLERDKEGNFRVLGDLPEWARLVGIGRGVTRGDLDLASLSPFVEHFLGDAEEFWMRGEEGRIHSGVWTERGAVSGDTWNFEAQAILLPGGEHVLLIQQLDRSFEELLKLLQQARSASLDHHQLRREIDHKEVLLHCIVHDLKGPLSGMMGGFSLLKSRRLKPERLDELVDIGLRLARRQSEMIQNILDVFAAELAAIETIESGSQSPSLRRIARAVIEDHRASFLDQSVAVELSIEAPEDDDLFVVGASKRLQRVLMNLLENALRHSPSHGRVDLRLVAKTANVRVEVLDRGPGVEPELEGLLFQRFVGSAQGGGAAGLGLYSCRLVVEKWGGTIGYDSREGGGAVFWFELPRSASESVETDS